MASEATVFSFAAGLGWEKLLNDLADCAGQFINYGQS
jgi:hypothetical protein